MTFVRTVLGDIPAERLGTAYAHEHLIIAGGRPVQLFPDFRLDSVEEAAAELRPAIDLGLRAVIDAMPCDAGRDVTKLAALSRTTGIHVIAPTGLHHERYYDDRHWSVRLDAEALAELFGADVTEGIDELDYAGPVVRRTEHRAGVVKVAGSAGGPSDRDRPIFQAAAITQRRTGVPILTHCEAGTGAVEQVELLTTAGADPRHVALSHVDKVVDRDYHRELCATGAALEYDGAFRWGDSPNGTLQLLEWLAEDGLLDHVVLGHDAARRGYWATLGGSPGLAFLLGPFRATLHERGFGEDDLHRLFVANPARVFAFRDAEEGR